MTRNSPTPPRKTGQAKKVLASWFRKLTAEQQEACKSKWKKFVKDCTSETGTLKKPCLEVNDNKKYRGISDKTRECGRLTIKPFIFFQEMNGGIITDKDFKGPEVALATMPAIFTGQEHDEELVCSHRCHNKKCINPDHLCWEIQANNSSRNTCGGPDKCIHDPPCLVRGPAKLDTSKTLVISPDGKFKKISVRQEIIELE